MLDHQYSRVVERFQDAALGSGSWTGALEGLADLTGGHVAQLIGLGAAAAVPFNWFTAMPPEAITEFEAAAGHFPSVNSRIRIGGRAPELTVLDESAFTTDEDCRRNPEYGEWVRRYDLTNICLSPLLHQDGLMVGLAVLRGRAAGNITLPAKRLYARVAPHVRAAVRTQMAIEQQGFALLADVMEAVSIAAFVCGSDGRVLAMSPSAERLIVEARWLGLRNGRLTARSDAETACVLAGLAQATAARRGGDAPPSPIVVTGDGGDDPLLLEASAIPGEHAFRFDAAALLIARCPRDPEIRSRDTARALYGLTGAEAVVAGKLVAGLRPDAVAEQTGVSVGTVRSHIRRIFEKARVNSQLELVAAISARL